MTESARRATLGWLAVAAQVVVGIGIVVGSGEWSLGPAWLAAVGLVLLLSGAVVALLGVRALGSALTPTPVPIQRAGLRTDGLYRHVRHPIYTGALVASLGFVLCVPSPWRAGWWLVLLVLLFSKSVWEERMLTAEYPDYPDYARRTGRFLPRIRR